MKYCVKCRRTLGENFCHICGSAGVARPKCECGEEVSYVDKFCENCGRPVQHLYKQLGREKGTEEEIRKGGEEGEESGRDVSGERDERDV